MKVKHLFFLILPALFAACNHDADTGDCGNRNGDYSKGVFVVNEGPFGGSGSISWHNDDTGETVEDVFASENCGAKLGQFVQSITFYKDRAFIVVNGADKIVVVDAATFEQKDVITGIASPRYFTILDDQYACVTYWGADGFSGGLAKVDLNTLKVLDRVSLPQPEKVYVLDPYHVMTANVGGYGLDSTVSFVDIGNVFQESSVVKYKGAPACFDYRLGEAPMVLCKGGYGPAPDFTAYPGWLANTGTLAGYEIPNGSDDLCANPDRSALYFIGGGSVWAYKGAAPVKLFDQAAYGLGCHPQSGNLYCADAKDFSSNGTVYVYKPDGTLLSSFAVGIAPGEVTFRK